MMVDLVSQMKTVSLMTSIIQGDFQRCSPYSFEPYAERPLPDHSLYGLETSTPEAQGVESAWLNGYISALRDCSSIHPHSVAVLRHGKLLAEGSFLPYTAAYPHMQFSLSKSVVGMAVGIAVGEGLLSVEDKLVDFFADDRSLFRSPKLSVVTVRNLLQMTAGVKYNEMFSITDRDWVHGFLSSDCLFDPGSDFYYNSMNTYMLCAVLRRVTGVSLVEYLTPRLFDPMQIPRPRWETCPLGIEKGGWGLYLRCVDMAKLGQLYLQEGRWQCPDGVRQLVPAQWVADSVENMVPTGASARDSGYGYQLWNFSVDGAFQYSGIYGQHVFVLPHLDAVVAMTSGSQTFVSDEASSLTEKYFSLGAEGFHDTPLPQNLNALRKLKNTLTHLYAAPDTAPLHAESGSQSLLQRLLPPPAAASRPVPEAARPLEGTRYCLSEGAGTVMPLAMQVFTNHFPHPVQEVSFNFTPGLCHVCLRCGEENIMLTAGLEEEPFRSLVTFDGESYPVGCSARLTPDEDGRPVLKLYISFLQTPFTRVLKFIFCSGGARLTVRFDEQPSIEESGDMMFSVMGGNGLENRFYEEVAKQKLRPRLKELALPKRHGERQPQETAASTNAADTTSKI